MNRTWSAESQSVNLKVEKEGQTIKFFIVPSLNGSERKRQFMATEKKI